MDLGLRERVALVTGGARSLGRADAEVLAGEGCRIAIVDLNAEAEVAQGIEAAGRGRARGYACDVRQATPGWPQWSGRSSATWDLDICVTNAGIIYTLAQLKDLRDEDWELNLAVNLTVRGEQGNRQGGAQWRQ